MDPNIDERRGQVEKASTEAKTDLVPVFSDSYREESCANNLKSHSSSAESIYDLIEEESVDLSDDEVCNDQKESVNNSSFDLNKNVINGEVSKNNSSGNVEEFEEVESEKGEDNTDCNSMDEEFVIVDDDASEAQEEKKTDPSSAENNASDHLSEIDEIIDEFSEKKSKVSKVLKVDPEDELDSLLEEFVESEKKIAAPGSSSEAPTVVSAEGDKEIETLLDAFKEQNDSDDDCLIIEDGNASESKESAEALSGDTIEMNQKPNKPTDKTKDSSHIEETPVFASKNIANCEDLIKSDTTNAIPNHNEVNNGIKIEAEKVLDNVVSECVISAENLFSNSSRHTDCISDEIVDANKLDNPVSCSKRKESYTCESVKDECEDEESAISYILRYLIKQTVAACNLTNETCSIEDDTEIVNRAPDISVSELLTVSNSKDSMSEEATKNSDLDNDINDEIDVSGNVSERPSSEQNCSIKPCSVVINVSCEESYLQMSPNSLGGKANESNSEALSDGMQVANSKLDLGITVCSKSNTEDDEAAKSSVSSDPQRESPVVQITDSLDFLKKEAQNDKKRKFDDTDFSDSGSQVKKVKDDDTEIGINFGNMQKESKEMLAADSEKAVEAANTMAKELKDEMQESPLDDSVTHISSIPWLCHFAALTVMNYIESFDAEVNAFEEKKQTCSDQLKSFDKVFEEIKKALSDFMNTQQAAFLKHDFKNKLLTRTVGVNVKIYKNSALPNTRYVTTGNNAANSDLPQRNNITITPVNELNKPVLSLPMFARRMPLTPVLNQVRRPGPPNVTTSEMVPVFRSPGSRMVTNPQSMVVFSNTMGPPPRQLTAEEIANRKTTVTTQSYVPASSSGVAKVLTGVNSNQNVLVPFSNLLLQRPVIPQLPPNMIGARTLTYIVPPNSGPLSSIGGRAIPPFISSSGQRVQLVVRVTNPNSLPTASTAVNTLAKIAATQPQASTSSSNSQSPPGLVLISRTSKHPAPFPAAPTYQPNNKLKALPPKPSLKGSKAPNGIILSWNMSVFSSHADIATYQLFAYQESNGPVSSNLWKKVGDVKALPLPMACTLTQFQEGHRYYFTVRAVDTYSRFGPFSDAVTILFADGDPPATH